MTPPSNLETRPTEPATRVEPTPPPVLDSRYELLERLGAGGMGVVHRARHVHLGHEVAVKVLRATAEQAEVQLERLRREARAASAIGNPHIVDVKDFGADESGETYVVMELLDGQQLFEVLNDEEQLGWERAARIAIQICDALAAAHADGIVHRDLKPENVMLVHHGSERDFVKVLDFGIAKLMKADKRLTVAGQLLGTPAYMSPEQCRGLGLDHRSDVYALGVLLYEMVTGTVPFDDDDPMEVVYQHLMVEPPPPSVLVDVPAAFERIILRCLNKEATERFADMHAARAALEAVLEGDEPVIELVEPASVPEPEVAIEPARRGPPRWLLGAIAGVALLAGGISGGVMTTSQAQPEVSASATASQAAVPPAAAPAPAPTPEVVAAQQPARVVSLPAPAEVTLSSDPPGAAVFVDGSEVGQTPWTVTVPSGDETLEAELRAAGHRPRRIVVSAQTHDDSVITLERRARPRAAATAARVPSVTQPTPPAAPAPEASARPSRQNPFLNPWAN